MLATVRMDGDGIFARSAFRPQTPVFPGDAPEKLARMYPSPRRIPADFKGPKRHSARRAQLV